MMALPKDKLNPGCMLWSDRHTPLPPPYLHMYFMVNLNIRFFKRLDLRCLRLIYTIYDFSVYPLHKCGGYIYKKNHNAIYTTSYNIMSTKTTKATISYFACSAHRDTVKVRSCFPSLISNIFQN